MMVYRLVTVFFSLLVFSSLLCQMITPVYTLPSCPRSCSCPGVKEVHCTFRHLTTIPKTFPKDTQRLNLGYNSLMEVEGSEFRSLRQLEMLMLHGNDISTLHPGAFYSLRTLQILKLSYNKLTSLNPGVLEGLVGLTRLHLDHNLISFIEPYSFSTLTSLKLLQLEGNVLKEIHPHTFITLSLLGSFWTSGLRHLYLSDNLLEQLPAAALNTAPRLELLTLHNNPWVCDCHFHWILDWSSSHEGVIKCKKERDPDSSDICPQCFSPQSLNGTSLLGLSSDKLICERPVLRSPLKQWDSPVWAESEAEPDIPYTRDFDRPLGQLSFVLSDSHSNNAHVACDVRQPGESSPISWTGNPQSPGDISVNVSLVTVLECEIDRETLQNLWQLVAYYYESPAILERGQQRGNASRVTYQYAQIVNDNSPYFTDLKGYLVAAPSWLLQPKVTLRLNRQQTTTKKLVMDFTTVITKHLNSYQRMEKDETLSWALIRRGSPGRIQMAREGSKVCLECSVISSDPDIKVEWMLPDMSVLEGRTDKIQVSDIGELVIFNATLSDSGLYHCMVRSKIGVELMSFRLVIKEHLLSPTAFNGEKIILERGQSLSLPCEIISTQPCQIMWYLPKNQVLLPIQKTRRVEVTENGTLVIRKVTQEDAGEYSCLAANLYGVDMISHIVEVKGETDKSKEEPRKEQHNLLVTLEEEEGSGGDYQEIMGPFATQFPKKVGSQQKNSNGLSKRIRFKDSKRKPNKSVKELHPSRWAEILAKANAKPNVPLSTEQSLADASTEITTELHQTTKSQPTTTPLTITNVVILLHTAIDNVNIDPPVLHPPPVRTTEPSVGNADRITVTDTPAVVTIHPVEVSENKHHGEGRANSNLFPNRRRLPYRRRKPQLQRIHPHHSSNMFNNTVDIRTTSTTTTTTTIMTTTTPPPTTISSTEYQPEEDDGDDYKEYDVVNTNENLTSKTAATTEDHDSSLQLPAKNEDPHPGSSSHNYNLPDSKSIFNPIAHSITHPTDSTTEVNKKVGKINESDHQENVNVTGQERHKGHLPREREKEVTREEEESKHKIDTKGSDKLRENFKKLTPSYNTHVSTKLITQNRLGLHTQPNTSTQARTSSFNVIPSTRNKLLEDVPPKGEMEKANAKPGMPNLSIMEPIHPWLHHHNQGRGQTNTSTIKDQDTGKGKEGEVKPHPTQIPPTTHWSSHHLHHSYPSWPSQTSFLQPRQGPELHPVPTHQPWPFLHPWVQGPLVANRPEITAETVKATPTGSSRLTLSNPHLSPRYHQNHHVDSRGQTRDLLFLSRLRNRYRQAQLDRIAQLGKMMTPKPHTNDYNIPITPKHTSPHRPYTLKPPSANTVQAPNHAEASFPGVTPTPRPQYQTTPQLLYGGRISFRHPTAAPPFLKVLAGEGDGFKPKIITVTTASVTVLAESHTFLPCKAIGIPEPHITWTKVSTGATIPVNTKHGQRFEVLTNGTFVIKNIQLQDRGQYLCTAQNRFGSDRMVITLAVQTQVPQIQHPKSTDIVVYMGKSVTLDCLASGKPTAQISWILPDRTFVRDVGAVVNFLSPVHLFHNGTLQIHSANFSNKGYYKCIASNAAGADTMTYHLHVAALPPSFSERAVDTVVIQAGRSVYVHCSVKGEPPPAVKWMLPAGVSVKPSQFLGRRLFVFPNGTLYVKNVLPSDNGRYDCLATNAVGVAKKTIQLEVREDSLSFSHQLPPPLPLPLPIPSTNQHVVPSQRHSVTAMYGSAVYLHCPESTASKRGTIWKLPSKTILEHRYSPERPIKVFRNGTLRILQLTELDGGNYFCVFQRPNGEDMELFQVDVLMTPPRIEHVRTAQTRVPFGENFQVDCVATGLPDPEVSWSLPDGTLINSALQSDGIGLHNRRYIIFGNGTLILQQMGKKDEGDYTCFAKNKLGKDERKVSIKVGPNAPQITSKLQLLVTVKLGDSARLRCQATGEPTPRIMWISPRNNAIPELSDRFQIMDDGTLVIKKITLTDEGKYVCVAQNSVGNDIKNMKVEVESQEPFINSIKGKSTAKAVAVSYQTALLDCRVKGKPEPRVWWVTPYGQSFPIPYLGGRFQVHLNGSLELRGVRKTDEGQYTCLAKNQLGEASLVVDVDVASLAEKPSFAVPNIEILPIKKDNSQLILECPARGKPNPDFAWLLPNGTMLLPGVKLQRFNHHLGNGTLRISQPAASDKGIYRCLAKNVAGQAEKRYALETGRKPVIRGSSGEMKVTYGNNLYLPCTVDGWPQASITWTLPNGLVLDKAQTIGRITLYSNGTLHLRQVATFDKGRYICKGSNSFGTATLLYPVIVMVYPPHITSTMTSITRVDRGSSVILNCVATGIPKPDISWTLPGRTTLVPHNRFTVQGGIHMSEDGSLVIQNPILMNSGIYKCNAKNALGTDFKSTYLQVV